MRSKEDIIASIITGEDSSFRLPSFDGSPKQNEWAADIIISPYADLVYSADKLLAHGKRSSAFAYIELANQYASAIRDIVDSNSDLFSSYLTKNFGAFSGLLILFKKVGIPSPICVKSSIIASKQRSLSKMRGSFVSSQFTFDIRPMCVSKNQSSFLIRSRISRSSTTSSAGAGGGAGVSSCFL